MSRHRRPKPVTRGTAALTAVSALWVLTQTAGSASAATTTTWDKVADCESGGDWSINTGNGFYGGLQFSSATWAAYGGHDFAPQANRASRAQQITVAERVLNSQGPGAWPICGPQASLQRGSTPPVLALAVPEQAQFAAATATAASTRAAVAVSFARLQLGRPYLWGGTGRGGYDCSGLTQAAWRHAGVSIPRTSWAQLQSLPRVSLAHLQPGDIVGYYGGSHVALYVGNGKVVEANNPREGIVLRSLFYDGRPTSAVRPRGAAVLSVALDAAVAAPVVSAEAAVDAPAGRVYTVRAGDDLYEISLVHHIKGGWPALYTVNAAVIGSDPDLIRPGQLLQIPA